MCIRDRDNADYAKNQKIGSFVGLCSNLKSKNNIIYSGTDAETSSAVSYTHLDVYKRQT